MMVQSKIIGIFGAVSLLAGLALLIYGFHYPVSGWCVITPPIESKCYLLTYVTNYRIVAVGLVLIIIGIGMLVAYAINRKHALRETEKLRSQAE